MLLEVYVRALQIISKEKQHSHSSVAWRIPGKGEPGGLPSMGSHVNKAEIQTPELSFGK